MKHALQEARSSRTPSRPEGAAQTEDSHGTLAEPLAAPAPIRGRSLDLLQYYLQEIGHVPLLSAEEEIALGKQIEREQTALAYLGSGEPLPPKMLAALEADIICGQAARSQLIQANLRLVVNIARNYTGQGLSLSDLIQEGNLGLMRAAEKFDHHRGNRFSTYATWWIRQGVTRAIAQYGRSIRIPVHMNESVWQLKRTTEQLTQAFGREPTLQEISNAVGQPLERIKQLHEAAYTPTSLQTLIEGDSSRTVGDLVSDDGAEQPSESVDQQQLRSELSKVLSQLNHRERCVISMRYGLSDGSCHTLAEIGKTLGITRERVRQLEIQALRRLRALEASQHLRDYLE